MFVIEFINKKISQSKRKKKNRWKQKKEIKGRNNKAKNVSSISAITTSNEFLVLNSCTVSIYLTINIWQMKIKFKDLTKNIRQYKNSITLLSY